ncbi:MAG: phytanoyl-CoA dioxygenase [Herminiimonas sp.]|nr:phytanoyl-CoA dioxygenase [Herminiimonas sp.]
MDQSYFETAEVMGGLYGDGIIARKSAFSVEFVRRLRDDINLLKDEAKEAGNLIHRGPNRYYTEIHPERLSGFAEIISHPWFQGVCNAVLGPAFKIIEVGFDIAAPGAEKQPWHRDFASPVETTNEKRLTSLAFNMSTVNVEPGMGPLEIAPGTQWDYLRDEDADRKLMFPKDHKWDRYESLAVKKFPQMGDISARTALMIHRGTANVSSTPRPVLVIGVDGPSARNSEWHDLQVTRQFYDSLPAPIAASLGGRIVDKLVPIVQEHKIEGLSQKPGKVPGDALASI